MIITCAACSAHACCCRDRCHALSGPSSLPSPSRSVRKAVITLVLHSTIMSLHVSQLHVGQLNVSQLHSRHAPCAHRRAHTHGDAARSVSIGVREQYLVALRVVSAVSMARMRCDAVCPSMTLSAEKSPWTRKHL